MSAVKSGKWANRRPWTPEEIETLRAMYEADETDAAIGKRLNRSDVSICTYRKAHGMTKYWKRLGDVPADFREVAPGRSIQWLREYYGCGYKSIRAWRLECGMAPEKVAPKPKPRRVAVAREAFTRAEAPRPPLAKVIKPIFRVEIEQSVPSLAAQHLRRFYGSVHRADIRMTEKGARTWGDTKGLPDGGRGMYFVSGVGVVPDYEVVAIARDHGFAA